jgi:hypothetical protein
LKPLTALHAYRLKRHGVVIPLVCIGEARRVGLELAVAAAMLMQETGGGRNLFGHDPTVAAGWGTVTRPKYAAYKRLRDARGHGTRCQGVGPTQLTSVGYQDRADAAGGCWRPGPNCRVGFGALASLIRSHGVWGGCHRYNGSGPWAVRYANTMTASIRTWRYYLDGGGTRGLMARLTPHADLAAPSEDEIAELLADHAARVKSGQPTRQHV